MTLVLAFLTSPWTATAAILIIGMYYWYKRPKNFPPGPRGVPLMGVLPFMTKFPERAMQKWSGTYGPVMSLRLGPQDVVVLNSFDSIQQAFVKQGHQFSGRPNFAFIRQVTHGKGLIFIDYDEEWKTQRKFGLMTLRGFGVGKQSMESTIIEESSYLINAVREQDGKVFDISLLVHNAVSNIISKISLGKRFEYEDTEFREVLYRHSAKFNDPVMNALMLIFQFAPILMKIPPFSSYNRVIKEDLENSLKLLEEIIQDHQETFDETQLRDFIDAFLLEIKNNNDESFTLLQLAHYVRDIFEAGTDTTSNTLYWSILALLVYPKIQEKLRKEIMDVIGPAGKITVLKRSEMPYTSAFMEELLRFRPVGPLGLYHSTSEDSQLGKHFIPKGTMVTANFWAVHNDKALWEKPEIFNPERFINEKGEFVKSPHVMSFSVGPRHCLGEHLARMEFFIFLVSLVRSFEFLPDPKAESLPDIENASSGFFLAAKPYNIVAKQI